jgi:Ca2+-binding RTX toxin-like protein
MLLNWRRGRRHLNSGLLPRSLRTFFRPCIEEFETRLLLVRRGDSPPSLQRLISHSLWYAMNLFSRVAKRSPSGRSVHHHRTRLAVEALDQRILPAVTFFAAGSTLVVLSDAAADSVEVRPLAFPNAATLVAGVFQGTGALLGTATLFSGNPFVPILAVGTIAFDGGAGDDRFVNSTSLPATLSGGPGKDVLIGGSGNDILIGGPNDDTLDGRAGINTVAESGDVNFLLSSTKLVGLGTDTLTNIQAARLTGGDGANTLKVIDFAGNATLDGGAGDDSLFGGSGNDVFIASPGNDRISGGLGINTLQVQADGTTRLSDTTLTSVLGTDTLSLIERATLTGGPGNDVISAADFSGPVTVNGGAGNDLIQGGAGSDVLIGGAGSDVFMRSGGTDSNSDFVAGTDTVFGLVNRALTPAELSRAGSLGVALVGDTLTIAGPSGAGFQIVGGWFRGTIPGPGGTVNESFSATGALTLKTALGDMPFLAPATAPLRFSTAPDTFTSFGTVTALSWDVGPGLVTSTLTSPLHGFLSTFGISLTTPDVQWGLRLGHDLHSLLAPLNDAVPYIFFNVSKNFTLQFGGLPAIPILDGNLLTVVFDPSDPFLYIHVTNPIAIQPLPSGTVELAASIKGQIPFTPEHPVSGVNEQIFGHAYAKGDVTIPVPVPDVPGVTVPITLHGNAVLDLDANRDGVFVNLNGAAISRLFFGLSLPGPLADVRLGVNGEVDVGLAVAGFSVLTLPVAGTGVLGPDLFAFKGECTTNLFAGTPLSVFKLGGTADVEGSVQTNGQFSAHVEVSHGAFGGFTSSDQFIDLRNSGVSVSVDVISLPFLGTVNVSGSINGQGQFSLTGAVDNDLIPQPNLLTLHTHTAVTLSNTGGPLTLTGLVSGHMLYGIPDIANVSADIAESVTISPTSSGLRLTGTGSVTGSAQLFPFGSISISAPFPVTTLGFTIGFPFPIPALTFPFNTPPAFRQRTVTPSAAAGELVTVSGMITEVDPQDTFALDVDWGDGLPVETFISPAGSDGQTVTVTHRYAESHRASVAANDYLIILVWHDPRGGSNNDSLTTTITNPPLTADERFISHLYADLLGRPVEDEALPYWSDFMNQNGHTVVAAAVQDSDEYQVAVVQGLYQTILRRPAEQAGLEAWIAFLRAGGTTAQLNALLYGSTEYFQNRGEGNNAGFAAALYEDVLGRFIDPQTEAWATAALVEGMTSNQLAALVLNSEEAGVQQVEGQYQRFLSREADGGGLAWALALLKRDRGAEQLLTALADSVEYFARLT